MNDTLNEILIYYLKNSIKFSQVTLYNAYSPGFEYICVRFVVNNKQIIALTVYRSPSGHFRKFISHAVTLGNYVLILVDMIINYFSETTQKRNFQNIPNNF